ncbi:uncharacterized protein [Rutidosis leptorrhynchoides]|uniref:uncharacterized protein n=1 Tax=Rutidosis leptorrhynchoides TaxID=125765 RepID=UPI003A992361
MAPNSKVSLKLQIDRKGQKVLFAEAGKDFVDFLFSLLTLPIGTIMRLLDDKNTIGGLSNLYHSVSEFNNDYILQKDALLKPKTSPPLVSPKVPLPIEEWSGAPSEQPVTPTGSAIFYKCGTCNNDRLSSYQRSCDYCRGTMCTVVDNYVLKTVEKGFVKGLVTYMVTDNLGVSPMSTISSITLLNKFNVKDLSALEEKVVHIGMDEGLELLKYSLSSNTVLTDVFLREVAHS